MHGVTTAIVAFIFAGVIWPHLSSTKCSSTRPCSWSLFIIVLDGIGYTFAGEGGRKAIYSIIALLQVVGDRAAGAVDGDVGAGSCRR